MNYSVIKSLPYHLQVYEILRNMILSGQYKPGERLYENRISEKLGVSRSPIREALRMLAQDELVIVTSNGAAVNPIRVEDLEEVYQCRMAVEPFAARLAANLLTEDQLNSLKTLIEEAEEYHRMSQFEEVISTNTEFHGLIIQSCGNSRLQGIIEKIKSLIILSRIAEFKSFRRNNEYLQEHKTLLDALTKRDGELSEQILRKHIENDFKFNLEQICQAKGGQQCDPLD